MARRPARDKGLTLLELVVTIALLVVFLAMTHDALGKILLYPHQSLRRFSDRSEAMTVERYIVESMKAAQEGYVWARSNDSGTSILMGLAREFRSPDEPPVTDYMLFSYDRASTRMLRWSLTPEQAQDSAGRLSPHRELSERGWRQLLSRQGKSLVASHLTNFVFELGEEDKPAHLVIEVNSSAKNVNGEFTAPSRHIDRLLSKVRDASE